VQTARRGLHVKRLALSLSFRRPGRYRLRARSSDINSDTGYKRATVVVSPSRAEDVGTVNWRPGAGGVRKVRQAGAVGERLA